MLVSPLSHSSFVGFSSRTTVEVFIEVHSLYSGLYTEKKKIRFTHLLDLVVHGAHRYC